MELLEKTGASFDAAAVAALESGDDERAYPEPADGGHRDIQFHDACRQLATLFSARGDHDLAVAKLEESLRSSGEDTAPLELMEQLGDALERAGEIGRAVETFENIRKRDYSYPNAAERIVALRERLQSETVAEGGSSGLGRSPGPRPFRTPPPQRAATSSLEEIGRGGMGVVYKARDTRLGRVVALKRLPDNLRDNPTAVQLFLREARAAAALNHPNIVTVYDADEEDGDYFITMELLEGLPLDADPASAQALARARRGAARRPDLRRASSTPTSSGIVHRDIKTANLFFTQRPAWSRSWTSVSRR